MPSIRASFPMTAEQAQLVQAAYAAARHMPLNYTLQLKPDLALPLVLIPPGDFIMGLQDDAFQQRNQWAPPNDRWQENHLPPHVVRVHRPFYLGRTAVTQAQWQAVLGFNPSLFTGSAELPVENFTALDADTYSRVLSALTGQHIRLPTASEWEYACRAGSAALFHFGDSLDDLWDYAWYRENSSMQSHPVGRKLPNPWGLYDMHGGIDEYCQDAVHPSDQGAPDDQRAWIDGGDTTQRIKRGGSWYDVASYCIAGHINSGPVFHHSEDHGMRVVMELPIVTN